MLRRNKDRVMQELELSLTLELDTSVNSRFPAFEPHPGTRHP